VRALLWQIGLEFYDAKPSDVVELADRNVVRYLDAVDQRVVAYEFDSEFRCLGETRVHIANGRAIKPTSSNTWH